MTACLITRTRPGADQTADRVTMLGLDAIVLPAALIVPTPADIDLSGVQALLMTSAAAARHSLDQGNVFKEQHRAILDMPVFAVGDATAEAALAAGFSSVISAGGDGSTLAVLAADRLNPGDGALLHLRGGEVAGDVTGMLAACGFEARSVEVYHTTDHPDFISHLKTILGTRAGYVLFHSPAGARRFSAAVQGLNADCSSWHGVGLSQACLEPLAGLALAGLSHATRPDEASLIDTLAERVEVTSKR
jgi:uroporphyrinogen-III synthase